MDNVKIKKVISPERRRKYNQTYYDKHRLKLLKKWSDNFVSKKLPTKQLKIVKPKFLVKIKPI